MEKQAVDDLSMEMRRDFERCAAGSGGHAEAVAELAGKWGKDARSRGASIFSAWSGALVSPAPLWFAALARGRESAKALIDLGCELGHPSGAPLMQAWRYAAYNGWAPEAADLFRAQRAQGAPTRGGWREVWSAIAEGSRAQKEGWGEKAQGALEALAGSKLSAQSKDLIGLLGAFINNAPFPGISQPPAASGWDALAREARTAYGPCSAKEAHEAAGASHEAMAIALSMGEADAEWAQARLDEMVASWRAKGQAEADLEKALRQANPSGDMGWEQSKKKAHAWAAAAAGLADKGARFDASALDEACTKGRWEEAYALAKAGARVRDGSLALWSWSQALNADSAKQMPLAGVSGKAGAQPLEVAMALSQAGARAGARGADGLDAAQKLLAQDGVEAAIADIVGMLAAKMAGMTPGKPRGKPEEELEAKGLLPIYEFLKSAKEREDMMDSTPPADEGQDEKRRGSARL